MKIFSVLLFGLALACSGNSSSESFVSESKAADYEMDSGMEEMIYDEGESIAPAPVAEKEQKIIKTGRLVFETADPEATHKRILELTKAHNGFIQSDNSGKSYNRIFRNITVRIPTENFQAFVDGVSEGVPFFEQKDISRKDVTEEFVDLTARLKAKRELENRYLELLKSAKNVKEMLEIERELANIREEIEAKQGRLNYLQDRVATSTINIEFYKYTAETGVTVSYGRKMVNALKGGWDGISVFFLGILYIWPLLLIILIGLLVLRRYLRKSKKKAQN
ncbi:MAG: DUF4349 domain-containing protein [Flavobacteriaceae bacterium]|nr:DUF4349 domain-containing protein [Flavobacteriaceae bacterium]